MAKLFHRRLQAIATLFIAAILAVGLVATNEEAYAATSNSTLSAAKIAVAKSPYSTSSGNKIAVAAATISYSRVVYQGKGTGTKAYLAVCKNLTRDGYYAKNKKQMQCNVPVAAAVRFSGVDKKFPTTNKDMYSYMLKSKQWKCLGNYNGKESSLRPGDILIRIGGVTTYTDKNGKKCKAANNHACVYVGKKIATSVYKRTLKGTDADKGAPGSKRTFVSAHVSKKNPAKRSAACMETASQAYAGRMQIVFRHI